MDLFVKFQRRVSPHDVEGILLGVLVLLMGNCRIVYLEVSEDGRGES